jgi:hypothetical protein
MSNPNAVPPAAYQWKPGQSGNPNGSNKGKKLLSTWIQNLLSDEGFTFKDKDDKTIFEGAPIKAIIMVAIYRAVEGDKDAREWLAKHGYGVKLKIDSDDPVEEVLKRFGFVEGDTSAGKTETTKKRTS